MPFDNLPEPPQPSREVQLLGLARDSIRRPEQWVQGAWLKDGRICAVMAIQQVCLHNVERSERRKMVRRLTKRVGHEIPMVRRVVFCWLSSRQQIICFNDSRVRTHRQIIALFHRAIERLEWQEMSATEGSILAGKTE